MTTPRISSRIDPGTVEQSELNSEERMMVECYIPARRVIRHMYKGNRMFPSETLASLETSLAIEFSRLRSEKR